MTTVQINTTRFGTVDVEQETIINFVSPILGFEHCSQYVLLNHADDSPFKWLQAVSEADLAFVVTNPKFFGIPYEFVLQDDAVNKLGVQAADDVIVFTIVNIPSEQPAAMTANLLAPVVINQKTLQGMQLILQDASLSTRTRLLPDNPAPEVPNNVSELHAGQPSSTSSPTTP